MPRLPLLKTPLPSSTVDGDPSFCPCPVPQLNARPPPSTCGRDIRNLAFSTIDRAALRQQFEEFIDQCEGSVSDELIENVVATKLQPLLERLEQLEAKVSPPIPRWGTMKSSLRNGRIEALGDAFTIIPSNGQTNGVSGPFNPYEAPASRDLDGQIHIRFMKETSDAATCPRYSTEMREARVVLRRLRAAYSRPVVFGRTTLADRIWFVRAVTDSDRGTEVLADTLPLAICRLALLHCPKPATPEAAGITGD